MSPAERPPERPADGPALYLEGDIDIASEDLWRRRLNAALAAHPDNAPLVLDLGAVTFIDSRGLALLVYVYRELVDRGGRLVLARVTRRVERVLQVAALDQLFEVRSC